MKKIYKYQLSLLDKHSWFLNVKSFVKVLSVINQGGVITVYIAVDESLSSAKSVEFSIVGTGNPADKEMKDFTFLDTIEMSPLVWHIFYKVK